MEAAIKYSSLTLSWGGLNERVALKWAYVQYITCIHTLAIHCTCDELSDYNFVAY